MRRRLFEGVTWHTCHDKSTNYSTTYRCVMSQHINESCHNMSTSSITTYQCSISYGVATISRLLKTIGLFCKRALQKRRYSAKETYDFKEPTNRRHPIHIKGVLCVRVFCMCVFMRVCVCVCRCNNEGVVVWMCVCVCGVCLSVYGVATNSRLLKIICLFCRISSLL